MLTFYPPQTKHEFVSARYRSHYKKYVHRKNFKTLKINYIALYIIIL